MGDLKSALKEAKSLLSTGKSQETIDLLQDFIDREREDYMLFCFAALANSNLEEYEDAEELYEKAIALDASKPVAWMGLFKLYEAEDVDFDHRGLEVCDKICNIGDEDKKAAAAALRRRIRLQLGQFNDLLSDLGSDPAFATAVVDRLDAKKILSTTERQLVTAAYQILSVDFAKFPAHHLKFCKFTYESGEDVRAPLREYCSVNRATDAWIIDRLVQFIAEDYFVAEGVESHEFWQFLVADSVNEASKVNFCLLKNIKNGNLTAALDLLDQLSSSQTHSYPCCLIVTRLYAECENWENILQVLSRVDSVKNIPEGVKTTVSWFLLRAHLEISGKDRNPMIKTCLSYEKVPPEFIAERLTIEESADGWIEQLTEKDQKRVQLLSSSLAGKHEEAVAYGTELIQASDATWRDLLWTAEALNASGRDCVNILVKAAKLNPRSSRVFHVLGLQLIAKNPPKARGCLERAVKVRPTKENYVKALDQVLAKIGEKAEVRLPFLKALAKRTSPLWLRDTIAKLSLATNDLDTAIAELQRVIRLQPENVETWANLAEAYSKKGHLSASLNAYKEILLLCPDSDYAVALVGILIRLHKHDEALEEIEKWWNVGAKHADALVCMDILEAQSHLSLATSSYCEEKLEHIRLAIAELTPIVAQKPRYSLLYKLAGDALLLVAHCREDLLEMLKIDVSWNIKSCDEALHQASTFYSVALELSKTNVLAWKDLITSLLLLADRKKEDKYAKSASELLKHAISSTSFEDTKSGLWVLLGEARRLLGQGAAAQQHCYIRALQLNKGNDEAWLRLGILYVANGKDGEAHLAFETALKYNPQSAEAWCGWAAKAEKSGHIGESVHMYRQAMAIKSLPLAVEKYTAFECENMTETRRNYDTSSVLREFPEIFDVFYSFHSDTRLFTHLGVLAELFGHYDEAVQCHSRVETLSQSSDFQRVLVKTKGKVQRLEPALSAFAAVAGQSVESLFAEIKKNDIYGRVFSLLESDDGEASGLRAVFTEYRKQISMPLVVAAIIYFEIPISDAAVRVLHDVLPRHELIDVFPTILPEGLDRELKYLEQDGEAPFRYRHHVAKALFEELKKRKEELPPVEDKPPIDDEEEAPSV